jgi:hypothetical protein
MLDDLLVVEHVMRDRDAQRPIRSIRRHDAAVFQQFNCPGAPLMTARVPIGHCLYPLAHATVFTDHIVQHLCEKTIDSAVEG